jgi:hypothetical protein
MADPPSLIDALNESFKGIAGRMFQHFVERYRDGGARKEFNDNLKNLCAAYKDAAKDIQADFKEFVPAEPDASAKKAEA